MQIQAITALNHGRSGSAAQTALPVIGSQGVRYETILPHEVIIRYLARPAHPFADERWARERWRIDAEGRASRDSLTTHPVSRSYVDAINDMGRAAQEFLKTENSARY